ETHRSARIFTLYPDLGSFDSSKPSGRGVNVLLALPAAPGQARAIESLIDDAVLRGGRTGRPLFLSLPVVAVRLALGRAGLAPREFSAAGEEDHHEDRAQRDADDSSRAHERLQRGSFAGFDAHCDTDR